MLVYAGHFCCRVKIGVAMVTEIVKMFQKHMYLEIAQKRLKLA